MLSPKFFDGWKEKIHKSKAKSRESISSIFSLKTASGDRVSQEDVQQHVTPGMSAGGLGSLTIPAESTPILDLPPELLIYIFALILPDDVDYYVELHSLAQVCKTWHAVIMSTPSLWRYATPTNPAILQRALILSHDIPLVIRTTRCSWNEYTAFMRLVCPEMDRWESVELHVPTGIITNLFDCNNFLSGSAAPKLREMTIRCESTYFSDDGPEGRYCDLFQGNAPTLQCLTLESIAVPWTSKMLSGLAALNLTRLNDRGPTVSQLRSILEASPLLRKLLIWETTVRHEGATQGLGSIILEHLEELELLGVPMQFAEDFLQHVTAPACTSFQCSFIPFGDDAKTMEQLFLPWLDTIVSNVFPRANDMSLYHSQSGVGAWSLKGKAPYIHCSPYDSKGFIKYLGSALKQECPSFPIVNLSLDELSLQGAQPFLARLPLLTSLSLTRCPFPLEELSSPQTVDGQAMWLLPQLRSLRVQGDGSIGADILKFLQARDGGRNRSSHKWTGAFPRKLESLDLESTYEIKSEVEAVKAIVGQENVDWACRFL